jgi:hypothetical protein
MQWIRSHLSFANLVSLMALFIALGGTTYAAVALPKNSVGAKQIKKNAVTASEVKRNAVGAAEIRSNAVASGDIADNGVGGADLSDNSVGAGELSDNSVGAAEIGNNAVGSSEVANGSIAEADLVAGLLAKSLEVTVQRTDVALAENSTQAVEAACPGGTVGVGGGSSVDQTGSDDIKLLVSRPGNGGFIPDDGQASNEWRAVYRNPAGGTGAAEIRAFILCARVTP